MLSYTLIAVGSRDAKHCAETAAISSVMEDEQPEFMEDDCSKCTCGSTGNCHICQFNGCNPGEEGPTYDYPDGMCHGCYEIVGEANLVSGGCVECNHKVHEEMLAHELLAIASGVVAEHWAYVDDDLPF